MKTIALTLCAALATTTAFAEFNGILEADMKTILGDSNAALSLFRLANDAKLTVVSTITNVPEGQYAFRIYTGACPSFSPNNKGYALGKLISELHTITVKKDLTHGFKTIGTEKYALDANLDTFIGKVAVVIDMNQNSRMYQREITCGALLESGKFKQTDNI